MNIFSSICTLACAAFLPLAACAPSPAYEPPTPCTSPYGVALPDKPVWIDERELFCHLRLPQERNEALRRALAECVELELVDVDFTSSNFGESTLTLRREGALADTLGELAEVPQWLCLRLYRDADIDYSGWMSLVLRGAGGKVLWKGDPFTVAFQKRPAAAPVSLHAMLVAFFPKE